MTRTKPYWRLAGQQWQRVTPMPQPSSVGSVAVTSMSFVEPGPRVKPWVDMTEATYRADTVAARATSRARGEGGTGVVPRRLPTGPGEGPLAVPSPVPSSPRKDT